MRKRIGGWLFSIGCSLLLIACAKEEREIQLETDYEKTIACDSISVGESYHVETAEALGIENGILIPSLKCNSNC